MNKPFGNAKDFPDTEPMSNLPGEDGDAATQPAPLTASLPDGLGLELAPEDVTLYQVMGFAQRGGRVCPQPSKWLELHRLLQDHAHGKALPADPLIGSAWAATPPSAKRQCFHEQLEWADKNGCLGPVNDFLHGLRDSEWYAA